MKARRTRWSSMPTRFMAMMNGLAHTFGKHGEMSVAAAYTIGFRTTMMAEMLTDPMTIADPEFVRMGAEKMEATAEAAGAMAVGMVELQKAWLALFTGPMQAATVAIINFDTNRSPIHLLSLQQRWLEESASAGLRLVEATASLTHAGLPAFHRRTRANAYRLSRMHRAMPYLMFPKSAARLAST